MDWFERANGKAHSLINMTPSVSHVTCTCIRLSRCHLCHRVDVCGMWHLSVVASSLTPTVHVITNSLNSIPRDAYEPIRICGIPRDAIEGICDSLSSTSNDNILPHAWTYSISLSSSFGINVQSPHSVIKHYMNLLCSYIVPIWEIHKHHPIWKEWIVIISRYVLVDGIRAMQEDTQRNVWLSQFSHEGVRGDFAVHTSTLDIC